LARFCGSGSQRHPGPWREAGGCETSTNVNKREHSSTCGEASRRQARTGREALPLKSPTFTYFHLHPHLQLRSSRGWLAGRRHKPLILRETAETPEPPRQRRRGKGPTPSQNSWRGEKLPLGFPWLWLAFLGFWPCLRLAFVGFFGAAKLAFLGFHWLCPSAMTGRAGKEARAGPPALPEKRPMHIVQTARSAANTKQRTTEPQFEARAG